MTTGSLLSISHHEEGANRRISDAPYLTTEMEQTLLTSVRIQIKNVDPDIFVALGKFAQEEGGLRAPILRLSVGQSSAQAGEWMPDVLGKYQVLDDGVQFIPFFPFERGLSYRATLDPRPLHRADFSEPLTLDFSLPLEAKELSPEVAHIFPTSDHLPENLLRFYVCFSRAIQRGRVETEISLLGPNGEPAADALYRAPVELWDRSMQHLTVLLDPGRLKRGVGPNSELGPPLRVGDQYTLVVGSGLVDLSGEPIRETYYKRFRVTESVREHIAIERWKVVPPPTGSREPLTLLFQRPLDWALLSQTIIPQIFGRNAEKLSHLIETRNCPLVWPDESMMAKSSHPFIWNADLLSGFTLGQMFRFEQPTDVHPI